MENVKVIIWGLGAMGGGIADMLLKKKGVDIVGVVDWEAKVGKSMYEFIKTPKGDRPDVIIGSAEDVIKPGAADIVMVCTDSFTKNVFPKIKFIVERGINVITSAEEMSYPKAQNPELAEEMDRLAKENGVSILGTGINPGHIMDLLVLVWTGCMQDVEHITSRRVNSLSPFGPTVMAEQGIGMEVADFMAKKASGEMAGHVGFAESVGMMAEGLGISIDSFTQDMDPIVTDDEHVLHMRSKMAQLVKVMDERVTVHDFRMVTGPTHTNLIFDVVVPFQFRMTDRQLVQEITRLVQADHPNFFTVIEVDKQYY